ncbi:penicillin-binding protein, beta-lactamase class C [Hyaloraphidium curvatum]|nr:penicillin-binding protein, beta-lactamase class C [Hyaloraphidium curvatum]
MTARAVPADASAAATDPAVLQWMVGSPPPPEKVIRHSDVEANGLPRFFSFPWCRWGFASLRQLVPTVKISRGDGPVSEVPRGERTDLDDVKYTPLGSSEQLTWKDSLDRNFTDAIVILHKGTIVYEKYFGIMAPDREHMAASVTKSFTGMLASVLVHEGVIDENALVTKYVPELEGSAFGDATVRNVMDMRTGVAYTEDYADPDAGIWEALRATNFFPRPAGYSGARSTYEFLVKLKKNGPHGADFKYKTVNTDVLGWIIRRATGKPYVQLLSERFWAPLGCERDASISVDEEGTEFAGGGLMPCLRDLARAGEMLRLGGKFNGRQILPAAVVEDIRHGGSPEAFKAFGAPTMPGGAYRSQFWVTNNEHGCYAARGVHGQGIWVDPKADVVIARFASHPISTNAQIDPHTLPAYVAVAKHLALKH